MKYFLIIIQGSIFKALNFLKSKIISNSCKTELEQTRPFISLFVLTNKKGFQQMRKQAEVPHFTHSPV